MMKNDNNENVQERGEGRHIGPTGKDLKQR